MTPYFSETAVFKKLKSQASGEKEILFTDIDDTLTYLFDKSLTEKLSRVCKKVPIILAYISGQDFKEILQDKRLAKADLYLPAMGTQIWWRKNNSSFQYDRLFDLFLRQFWLGEKIYQIIDKFVLINSEFSYQTKYLPKNRQLSEYKISLNYYGDAGNLQKKIKLLQTKIPKNTGLIYSADYLGDNSFCLDLVPKIGQVTGKALPILYLRQILPAFISVVAGNGGNDIDMLFKSNSHAIIIGDRSFEAMDYFQTKNFANKTYFAHPTESGVQAILAALANEIFNPQLFQKVIHSLKDKKEI